MMVTPVKPHQNLGNGRGGLQDKALGDWRFIKKCPYSGCKATSKVNSAHTAVRPVPQGYYC